MAMANIDEKMVLVEKEIRDFYDALEMNLENIDKVIKFKNDEGQEQETTPISQAVTVMGQAMKRGRLVLDAEKVEVTYTLRKPVGELTTIIFTTDNCTAVKVRTVQKELKNKPESWDAVILLTGGMLTKLQLNEVSSGEEQILKYVAQLFLTY